MHDDHNLPRITFPDASIFPQVTRDNIALLAIETEHCKHVMRRILRTVADRKILLFTISACREDRVQLVELELARPREELSRALLQDILRINNVRRARILIPSEHPRSDPISAKM